MTKGKKIRVHVSTMGCAGITVDRSLCRDSTKRHNSPPPPPKVRVVAVLSGNGNILGVTPLSSALRQAPTRGEVSKTSKHRYLALWTESKIPSTITFAIDFPNQLTSSEKQVRSAACSRLMTKDFELYLGVAWDDNKPIPFAAAKLSLKPDMQSKAYDLPLYPVREVQLETFQPPKLVSQEEKKDDATTFDPAQCYGIDNLDALLRVHITIDEDLHSEPIEQLIEPVDEVELALPTVLNCSIRKEEPEHCWAAAKSTTYKKHEAAPRDHEVTDQRLSSSPLAQLQKRIAIDPIDEKPDYVKSCPTEIKRKRPTSYVSSQCLQRNDDNNALHVNDNDSLQTDSDEIDAGEDTKDGGTAHDVCSDDDNTANSADDTLLSQESFPALRMHIRKVERFVEGISLPECSTFERMVNPSFDDDESTVNQRDSQGAGSNSHPLKNMFARSQCGAIADIRTWLQSRDVDYEGNRDDFMSILSQTTRGTATTFAEPVLPLTKVSRFAASDPALPRSGVHVGINVPTKSESMEEADESTLDGTLNPFPIDERSYQKDHEMPDGLPLRTVDESSHRSIIGSTDSAIHFERHRDPSCANLNFFQCDDRISEQRAQAGLLKTSIDRSKLMCSDLRMPDDVLSQFVPQTSAAESASEHVSQQHADRFPGMLEGKLKNLFRLRKTQPIKNANQVAPPLQLLKTFPDPDGDYLSVGDLTLTTHERRLESENDTPHPDSDLVLLKNRSKKFLPAPSATISSFYAFSKTSSSNQCGDFPFDEADPFMQCPSHGALAPDMSAAAGLAWAKQRAEQANRRQPGKGL